MLDVTRHQEMISALEISFCIRTLFYTFKLRFPLMCHSLTRCVNVTSSLFFCPAVCGSWRDSHWRAEYAANIHPLFGRVRTHFWEKSWIWLVWNSANESLNYRFQERSRPSLLQIPCCLAVGKDTCWANLRGYHDVLSWCGQAVTTTSHTTIRSSC